MSLIFDEAKFDGQRAGFGFLVPKRERDRLAACTFVGTKFPHRAPDDRILLRCFFGGTGDEAILSESDESLVTIAREELRRILGLTAAPLFIEHLALAASRWRNILSATACASRKSRSALRRSPGFIWPAMRMMESGFPIACALEGQAAAGIPRA